MSFSTLIGIAVGVMTLVGCLVHGGTWLYKKIRAVDQAMQFVQDMATNHLPHMYHSLGLICEHLGVEQTEPPQIIFRAKEGKDDSK